MTVTEYAAALVKQGFRVVPGQQGTIWVEYERYTLMRVPIFCLTPPDPTEIRELFRQNRVAVVSYVLEPEVSHQANALLYLCRDQSYSLERLKPEMRYNVSRALKHLTIRRVDRTELLACGMQAFCDTRRRFGLADGTAEEFQRRFGLWTACPAHVFLGAWKDNTLAAFQCITEVDNWAQLDGLFSLTALRNFKPTDALIYVALSQYLRERGCCVVSSGLSSVQGGKDDGLHAFKMKVGFEAKPVHRAFMLNPFLAPFANRLTLKSVKAALYLNPSSRRLRKAAGTLASIIGEENTRQAIKT